MEEPFHGKVAKRALALGLLYLLQQVQKKVNWNANYVLGTWNAKRETRNMKRKLGTPNQMRGSALCIPQNVKSELPPRPQIDCREMATSCGSWG